MTKRRAKSATPSTAPTPPSAPSPSPAPAALPAVTDSPTDEQHADLVEAVRAGERMGSWAARVGLTPRTVSRWLLRSPELRAAIEAARDDWCRDTLAEAVSIADEATEATVQTARVRVDARIRAAQVWLSSGRQRGSMTYADPQSGAQVQVPGDIAAAAAILSVLDAARRRAEPQPPTEDSET